MYMYHPSAVKPSPYSAKPHFTTFLIVFPSRVTSSWNRLIKSRSTGKQRTRRHKSRSGTQARSIQDGSFSSNRTMNDPFH